MDDIAEKFDEIISNEVFVKTAAEKGYVLDKTEAFQAKIETAKKEGAATAANDWTGKASEALGVQGDTFEDVLAAAAKRIGEVSGYQEKIKALEDGKAEISDYVKLNEGLKGKVKELEEAVKAERDQRAADQKEFIFGRLYDEALSGVKYKELPESALKHTLLGIKNEVRAMRWQEQGGEIILLDENGVQVKDDQFNPVKFADFVRSKHQELIFEQKPDQGAGGGKFVLSKSKLSLPDDIKKETNPLMRKAKLSQALADQGLVLHSPEWVAARKEALSQLN